MYSGRSAYDIRQSNNNPPVADFFASYLNLPATQAALGVDLNYTMSNDDVFLTFQQTGDYVYPDYLHDLEFLLDNGVRVVYVWTPSSLLWRSGTWLIVSSLVYGDADYIGNWYAGSFCLWLSGAFCLTGPIGLEVKRCLWH